MANKKSKPKALNGNDMGFPEWETIPKEEFNREENNGVTRYPDTKPKSISDLVKKRKRKYGK